MYLTPLDQDKADDVENWVEWRAKDVGMVLPPVKGQIGILVMIPGGTGLCFYDELIEIPNETRRSRSS